jgi:hypothetical protein
MSGDVAVKTNIERIAFLESKTEELAKDQEAELIVDFDEALSEYQMKNTPRKIRFKGKLFEIPRTMPFNFGLFYMRHCIKRREGKVFFEIPDDLLAEFITKMFGKSFLEVLDQSDDVDMSFVFDHLVPEIMSGWGYNIKSGKANSKAKNG